MRGEDRGEGGGQWEDGGTALMDTGGSIRGERSAIGGQQGGRKRGKKRGRGMRSPGTYGEPRGM